MDPQQIPKTSKFYFRSEKCEIKKTLGGGYHPLPWYTSGSRTSETGGQIFAEIFLGVSRKNVSIFRKKFIYLPKFLTTSFFSHRLFSCFNILGFGRGGPNP